MRSRLVLHIGAPKTGTTALQGFLMRERRDLRRCGYDPVFLFNPSSRAFAEAFGTLDDRQLYFRRNDLHSGAGAALHFARVLASSSIRLARSSVCARNTVLSSEHFFLRLPTRRHVSDLAQFLGRFFGETRVVLYRRDREALTRSLYWEALKAGATVTIEEFRAAIPRHHCQERVFDTWSEVFGRENLLVRSYDPGRDTVADFIEHVLGLCPRRFPARAGTVTPQLKNQSPRHAVFEEIRRFNQAHPVNGESGRARVESERRRDSFIAALQASD